MSDDEIKERIKGTPGLEDFRAQHAAYLLMIDMRRIMRARALAAMERALEDVRRLGE